MYSQKHQYYEDPMPLKGYPIFHKDTQKAKTECLIGLQPRKKVSYVKLDIDQGTHKKSFWNALPTFWNWFPIAEMSWNWKILSIGTLIWKNRKLCQTRPCVCPNTGSNYDIQHQLLQKKSYKACSCSFLWFKIGRLLCFA